MSEFEKVHQWSPKYFNILESLAYMESKGLTHTSHCAVTRRSEVDFAEVNSYLRRLEEHGYVSFKGYRSGRWNITDKGRSALANKDELLNNKMHLYDDVALSSSKPSPYFSLESLIKKYHLVKPSEEWILPDLSELIDKVKNFISLPEFSDTNLKEWQKRDKDRYEKALRQICNRVLEWRERDEEERRFSIAIARYEREPGDDPIGRWIFTDIAILLTREPPKPKDQEYPLEEWLRMRRERMSFAEVAKRTGYSPTTVRDVLYASDYARGEPKRVN